MYVICILAKPSVKQILSYLGWESFLRSKCLNMTRKKNSSMRVNRITIAHNYYFLIGNDFSHPIYHKITLQLEYVSMYTS